MTVPLWDKQSEQLAVVRSEYRRYQSILLQSATGSGKTQMGAAAVESAVAKGHRVVWMAHRLELIDQTSSTFTKFDIKHSIMMSGRHFNNRLPASIASVGTLVNRIDSSS